MSHQPAGAPVQDGVVGFEPLGNVVRVQDRGFRCAAQSGDPHHANVGPGDGQDRAAADGRRAHRADRPASQAAGAVRLPYGREGVPWKEGCEMGGDRDRPHARTAAAVGDAERLVEVQVADVGAVVAGPADADLGVHVRSVEVDLPAVVVDDGADVADRLFEHAVGGRVGDHQRREVFTVGLRAGAQIVEIDVALLVAGDGRDLQPGQHGAGGVRSVSGGGDEADVAGPLAAARVVAPDREKTGVLSLGTGVGLQRNGGEAGDPRQPVLQVAAEPPVTRRLVLGGVGMHVGEPPPGDRHHLRCPVQLHRARAERDHGGGQGQVARLQPVQVTEQLGLGAVAAEHRMVETGRRPPQRGRQVFRRVGRRRGPSPGGADFGEGREHRLDVVVGRRFVAGDRDGARAPLPQVQLAAPGGGHHPALLLDTADLGGHCVEQRVGAEREAQGAQAFGEARGAAVNRLGDGLETFRPVVDGVEAGDHRRQHLGGADVAGGPVAPDVLLSRLERQAQGRTVTVVVGDADQAARQPPLQPVADGDVGSVRSAESHRQSEALGAADRDIGSPGAGSFEQTEGERIGGGDRHAAGLPQPFRQIAVVVDAAVGGRLLNQSREHALRVELAVVADLDLDAERLGAGADDFDRLRVAVLRHEETAPASLLGPAQGHRLGGGRGLIEQRGVRHLEAGEACDHRLEVEQGLQPALGDLRLIRRVGRVPAGVFQDVALDDRGRDAAVVAHADEAAQHLVAAGDLVEFDERRGFGSRGRQFEAAVVSFAADRGRHGVVDQARERGLSEGLEHLLDLGGPGSDVPVGEGQGAACGGFGPCHGSSCHSLLKSQAT